MERKPLRSGKLKSAGYDAASRTLEIEFENGEVLQYAPFAPEMFRRFTASTAPWSYFQDNIEDEYLAKKVPKSGSASAPNPFD
jgi:hypothetical protein